jgi:tetratricopeptide (TPR) repeat protein
VKLKRYESAIEDLRGLLRVDPNSLYPRMLLGKALKMIGDLQNAEESVSRGIDLDPKLPDSYIERGDIRCRMNSKKKIDEAITGLSLPSPLHLAGLTYQKIFILHSRFSKEKHRSMVQIASQ